MKKLSIEDVKQIQIQILRVFASYCDHKGLKYFLAYGTLIGAIRHHGYIPWDDDIDVIMPRPDYEHFVNSFKNERYKVFCPENDSKCPFPYAKLFDNRTIIKECTDIRYSIGLNIDIFVLDGLPSDQSKAIRHIKNCSFWHNIIDIKKISLNRDRKFSRNAILFLLKLSVSPIHYTRCIRRLLTLCKKYSYQNCSYCSDLSYSGALRLDKTLFAEGMKGVFEGDIYTIPVGYDSWLNEVYGDYMQLPPEEKRMTHHAFEAYLKQEIG
jgi:lipopolysaccharide cholinephosphotransferase